MKRTTPIGFILIVLFVLEACSPFPKPIPSETLTLPPAIISSQPSPTSTIMILDSNDPPSFPLSESGSFFVGSRVYNLIDASRGERAIHIQVFYPALKQTNDSEEIITRDANVDMSDAPYPLILTGDNSGNYLFRSHLASYGFVMVIVTSPGFSYIADWNNDVINGPLDFLYVLDELTSNPPDDLEGIMDTDRVGVAGYSSDGLFTLALGGARIDPEYYFSQCAMAPNFDPPLPLFLITYYCNLSERWDEFSSQVGAEISTVTDGLWQPTTDERILAIMPMAPDSAWLYGEKGLAGIRIPSLNIAGTADNLVNYELVDAYLYDHLVNSDRILISFIGKGHGMVENKEVIKRINHFAVAFFGYYLQAHKDYANYFSENFVSQVDDLAWGIYKK